MIIVIRNNKIHASYAETIDITPSEGESFIIIPDKINAFNLLERFQDAGFDAGVTGFLGLPNPLTLPNFFSVEELTIIGKKTATLNRVIREEIGIIWRENRFKIDTKTCQSLAIAITSILNGTLTLPLSWRDADGNFVSLNLEQLKELVGIIMRATEANFQQEEFESLAFFSNQPLVREGELT